MDQAERERIENVVREFLRREGLISNDHIIEHDWIRQEIASRRAREELNKRLAHTLTGGIVLGLLSWVGYLVVMFFRGGQHT